jgi:Putative glycolipid-binding
MAEPSEWRSSVEREVMWAPWERPGLEHLRLVTSDGDVVANGLVIGLEAGRPFGIGYEVRCDGRWRVREVQVATPDSGQPVLELLADGEGHWKRGGGEPVPEHEYDEWVQEYRPEKVPDPRNHDPRRWVGDAIYDFSEDPPKKRPGPHDESNRATDLGAEAATSTCVSAQTVMAVRKGSR